MKTKQSQIWKQSLSRIGIVILFILIIPSCSKQKKNSRIVLHKEYKNEILAGREDLKIHLISSSITGVSVCVSINGKTVWSEGMGLANKELNAPATPETKYRIGRTSQLFTAFLLAKLQEEGQLHIDSSFYRYVPDFPEKQNDFTLYQLGTYSAGFPEDDLNRLLTTNNFNSDQGYIKFQENDSLVYKPNDYSAISDYSISLLGYAAEQITQKSFRQLLKETILDPLGLQETVIDYPTMIIPNRATPYAPNYIAQLSNAPSVNLSIFAPSTGILTTADDLNKAGQAILGTDFFSQKSIDLFFTKNLLNNGYETNRGFGWWINEDREGRKMYIQLGSTIGGCSILIVYPEQKLVVSICSNITSNAEELPAEKIANRFLGKIDPRSQTTAQN